MSGVPTTYDKGDTVSLNALFYNKLGVLADPSSVTLKVIFPDGTQNTFSPTHVTTGTYSYDFATTLSFKAGRYDYRFEGTGTVTSAEEKSFFLRKTEFV